MKKNIVIKDPMIESVKRKARYNRIFKMNTPHVHDNEIKELIKKYPIKEANDGDEEHDVEAL